MTYKGTFLYTKIVPTEILERVCSMKLRSDDVVLVGYPKSGESTKNLIC